MEEEEEEERKKREELLLDRWFDADESSVRKFGLKIMALVTKAPPGGTLRADQLCVLVAMRRMDLHAFHGSRHCWHDCHAVERHVECVSVRILKVTAAHRSSCRPRDTRRRLKTFFGTFLRPRNASRARDSLSLSLSPRWLRYTCSCFRVKVRRIFSKGVGKNLREKMEGKEAIVQRMYRRYVKKIQNIQEIRVVMFEE